MTDGMWLFVSVAMWISGVMVGYGLGIEKRIKKEVDE